MPKAFRSILSAIIAAAATASALGSLMLQDPAKEFDSSLAFNKVDPLEVPDYLAWREFFDSVKSHLGPVVTSNVPCLAKT